MDRDELKRLLDQVRDGAVEPAAAVERLRLLPFEKLGGSVVVDHHRELRSGVPEVVLGEDKSAAQIARILASLAGDGDRGALATRVSPEKARFVVQNTPGAAYYEIAQIVLIPPPQERPTRGRVAVVAAGTSDAPVAEEAAVTLSFLGCEVERVMDVGVAGLQRVIAVVERLRAADVVIVVAGMEGALPSVVAGLVDRPLLCVPTSVGYGVGLGGYVAMLGMLASCSPGVMVVNIDNGFGAAVGAYRICQAIARGSEAAS